MGLRVKTSPWVPLWSGAESLSGLSRKMVMALRKSRGWKEGDLVVMYSGNMGLGHLFDEVLVAASVASSDNCAGSTLTRFAFFGGGKRRAEVVAFVDGSPRCPRRTARLRRLPEILDAHLASADVHLVSLRPGVGRHHGAFQASGGVCGGTPGDFHWFCRVARLASGYCTEWRRAGWCGPG